MGDPVLHSVAAPVDEVTDDIRTLVADMFETMDTAPGVGLAAPQVGVGLRIYTYSYQDDDGQPWRGVLINPELWMTPPEPGSPDAERLHLLSAWAATELAAFGGASVSSGDAKA